MPEDRSLTEKFVEMEHEIISFWEKNKILAKYLARNEKAKERFSFLDGPITANNPMAVHHAWGRTLKDLYQRYKTMMGFRQRYQNGFDNQGLWVEVEVEKRLGFKSKREIEKFGIARFVEECKKHTLEFAKMQTKQSQRLGYFMDWGNDYYTMSDENNYAIWAFLKKCWEGRWLYKGRDSVPWCPRCGTAISQHEISTEEYKELTHKSVFMRFPVVMGGKASKDEFLLVWTTTPWTIPGNTLVAVNPLVSYALVPFEGKRYYVAEKLSESIFGKVAPATVFSGRSLAGLRYVGPFDGLSAVLSLARNAKDKFHQVVLSEDLVSETEGTGLVHIAPGCGAEDFRLAKGLDLLECVLPVVDGEARYLENFGFLSGKNAKDDPELILKYLGGAEGGRFLFGLKDYKHRYPICWRCKSELIWRVVDEWYVAMGGKVGSKNWSKNNLREKMEKNIGEAKWLPNFGYKRELDWLNNMEDWLISKKRYWGLALPIWECPCGNFEVIGSYEELKSRAVSGWDKFEGHTPHRPWIDEVKIRCSKCGKTASRIPDVGNPWLDAGIVPYSTLKYFSDRKYWQEWFPADLVLEGFPQQFRNWFYSLIAMSTVLENKMPFKTLLGHASVKDEKGEEMHKSKGNAIWFDEAAEKMGVDVMRWMYLTQPIDLNLNFGYNVADEVRRRFFLIFWNCFLFYKEAAGEKIPSPNYRVGKNLLDRWLISKLESLTLCVEENLNSYDHVAAAKAIESFVVEDISNWYIRRSRDRLATYNEDKKDREACLSVLKIVFSNLAKLLGPFIPFLSESIWQNLRSHDKSLELSVHLTDFPHTDQKCIDTKIQEAMEIVRQICEVGHAERKRLGIKVRQPLAEARAFISSTQKKSLESLTPLEREDLTRLIMEELNVKWVSYQEKDSQLNIVVNFETSLSQDLIDEGIAREIVREIQDLRKQGGYRRDEVITSFFQDTNENRLAVEKYRAWILKRTCSSEVLPAENFSIKGLKT